MNQIQYYNNSWVHSVIFVVHNFLISNLKDKSSPTIFKKKLMKLINRSDLFKSDTSNVKQWQKIYAFIEYLYGFYLLLKFVQILSKKNSLLFIYAHNL